MTTKEAYKAICEYFELEPEPHGKRKLMEILGDVSHELVIYKKITIRKNVLKRVKPVRVDFVEELQRICLLYDVRIKTVFSKSRIRKAVKARVHYCRYIKTLVPEISCVELARFFKRDHASIIHYWYDSKVDCKVPPLSRPDTPLLSLSAATTTFENQINSPLSAV